MPNYQSIRDVPSVGMPEWQYQILQSLKENVETLMGSRDPKVRAVTSDVITANKPTMELQGLSATGAFTADDHYQLALNVRTLAEDVQRMNNTLSALLDQLKGN